MILAMCLQYICLSDNTAKGFTSANRGTRNKLHTLVNKTNLLYNSSSITSQGVFSLSRRDGIGEAGSYVRKCLQSRKKVATTTLPMGKMCTWAKCVRKEMGLNNHLLRGTCITLKYVH